jgi:hypothetical protein
MTRVADSPTMPSMVAEKPIRRVEVPDRFLSKLRAVMEATVLHPFTTTIIRVVGSDDHAAS